MSTDVGIREASPADYADIAAIYNAYIEQGKSSMDESCKVAKDIAGWVKKFNDREQLFVAVYEGGVIGWGIIKRYSDREGYRFACETAIYLQPNYRGKGIGTKFKQFIIQRCQSLDYHHLVAKIFASNQTSIEYNRKLGYEIVGRQKEIGYKNSEWMDIIIMQLII